MNNKSYGLRRDIAEELVSEEWKADYFEEVVSEYEKIHKENIDCNKIANILINIVFPIIENKYLNTIDLRR